MATLRAQAAALLAALVLLVPAFAAAQPPAPPPLGASDVPLVPVDPALLRLLDDEDVAAGLATALAELRPVLEALGRPLHPVWLAGDSAAVRRFLEEHVDEAGVLRFDGPTAPLDARVAQGVLDALGEARDGRAAMEGALRDLGALFATGELPPGAEAGPLPEPGAPDRSPSARRDPQGALAALEAHLQAHPDPWRPDLRAGLPTWEPEAPEEPTPEWHAALNVRAVEPQFPTYEVGEEVNITVVVGLSTSTRAPVTCFMSVRFVPTRALFFTWYAEVGPAGSANEVRTVTSFVLQPRTIPLGQYQIGAQCETVFSGDCCPVSAVRSNFIDVQGRKDDNDLTITDKDITVRILDSTPKPNPTTWKIELTATYRARMGQCDAHTYQVRIEAKGKSPQTLSKTSTCGTETVGPLVMTIPKGAELRVVLDPRNDVKENDESDNVAEKTFGKVQVLRVFPEWRGGYLAGMLAEGADGPPALLALTKDSELGDEVVAKVEFSRPGLPAASDPIAGTTTEVEDQGDGVKLWRLRRDLRTVTAGEHWIQAVAITDHGMASDPERARLLFWDMPLVLKWFDTVIRPGVGGLYKGDLGAGDPGAKEIRWRLDVLPRLGGVDKVSFSFWNKEYDRGGLGNVIPGLKRTMSSSVGLSFTAGVKSTDAQWAIKGDASITYCSPFKVNAVRVVGAKDTHKGCITGSVALEGRWGDGTTPQWTLRELRFTFGFTVGFKISILGWVLTFTLSPPVAKVVRMLADLSLNVDIAVSAVLLFAEDKARELIPGTGVAFKGTDIPLKITGTIEATVGNKALLRAGAKFAMDTELKWEYRPGSGFEWKSWKGCTSGCGLTFTAEFFGSFKRDYPCCILIQPFEVLGAPPGPGEPGPLTAADRDWLGEGYATFQGGAGGVLVEQVWPGTNPAVVARGSDFAVVAYSHDVPERPLGQSLDLRYAVWNGSAWRAPRAIEGEALNDESPALAVGSPVEVGAAWSRSKRPIGDALTLDEAAAASEVAFSRYDVVQDAWSPPLLLTDDERYDKLHAIAGDGLGSYLVAWVQDSDGSFDTDVQDVLWTRWVVGGTPLAPSRAAIVNTTQPPALAPLPGGLALVAWTEDADGSPATLDTQVRWTMGQPALGQWAEPRLASNASHAAHSPAFARDALGNVSLLWVERLPGADDAPSVDAVMRSRLVEAGLAPPAGLGLPPPPTFPVQASLAFERAEELHREPPEQTIAAPQLLAGADGHEVLAWQAGGNVQRLRYRGLEGSAPVRDLGLDGPADRGQFALREGLDGAPALLAAHLRRDAQGRVHLDVPLRALGPDAALTALAVDPPNPSPGDTVTVRATVASQGEAPTGGFDVAFRDNGAAFANVPVDSLAPGETAEVEATWEVAGDDVAHAVRAVADESGDVPDVDRGNNAAELTTVLPDPAVEEFWPRAGPGFVRLLGTVTNGGTRTTVAGTVVGEALEGGDAPAGVPAVPRALASAPLPRLAPGGRAVVDLFLPPGALPAGDHLLRLRIATAEDLTAGDSAREDGLRLGPDLAVGLDARRPAGATAIELRAVVENRGNIPSGPTTLEFREDDAVAGGLVAQRAVPPLAPGARMEFAAAWAPPPGPRSVFAIGDPAGELPDLDPSNNLAHDFQPLPPLPDLAAGPGSVSFAGDDIVVTAWNLGATPAAYASATVSAGSRSGMVGIAGVGPGEAGRGTMPGHRLNFSRVAVAGELRVTLDPAGRLTETDEANDLATLPLVGLRSPSHPSPFAWSMAATAELEFSAPPALGVVGYSFAVDQAPDTEPDAIVDAAGPSVTAGPLGDGLHYVHVRAVTALGEATGTLHYPLRVKALDTLAPVTTLTLTEETAEEDGATFVSGRTTFRLEARDPPAADGSSSATGVASTHFRIDGGAAAAYGGPFQLAGLAAGAHAVEFWSVDLAGNSEEPRRLDVELETPKPPLLTLDATGFVEHGGVRYAERDALVRFSARDPGGYRTFLPPGVAGLEAALDGGPFLPSGGSVAAVQPGDASGARHVLRVRAVGATGLLSAEASVDWVVDLDAPTAALPSVRWGPGGMFEVAAEGAVLAGPATFRAVAGEPTSGLAEARFYLDGELLATLPAGGPAAQLAWTVDTRDWDFGNHRVRVEVDDLLGHTGRAEVGVYIASTSVAVFTDPEANLAQLTPPANPSLPPLPPAPLPVGAAPTAEVT